MHAVLKLWEIILNCLVTLAVILAVILMVLRLLGFQVYTVLSGSMEPEIPTGALIYVRKADPQQLEAGDVITYRMTGDIVVTHRIMQILTKGENWKCITKGDANESADGAPVRGENVLGTPVLVIPGAGYAVAKIQKPPGIWIAGSAAVLLMLTMILPDLLRSGSRQKTGKFLRR